MCYVSETLWIFLTFTSFLGETRLYKVGCTRFSHEKIHIPVPYPELFWSRYAGLWSQTQTPKRSKVLIYGVSFRQRSLSQSQESDVLSYSERKIGKNVQGFAPGPHWGGLTAPLSSSKNRYPQKNCWIRHCLWKAASEYWWKCLFSKSIFYLPPSFPF